MESNILPARPSLESTDKEVQLRISRSLTLKNLTIVLMNKNFLFNALIAQSAMK